MHDATVREESFDDLADCYDALIDWPRRLANEGPFFRSLFEEHHVDRVADIACGTGHHAAMFCSWGLEVEGSDNSPAMLRRCRELHGENDRLRWVQESFLAAPTRGEPFDAVVCIGNSLSLAGDLTRIELAVRRLVGSVRPRGIGVVQVLNLWSIAEGPTKWQKVQRSDSSEPPSVVMKGLHRNGDRGFVELLQAGLPESGVFFRSRSISFPGLSSDGLETMLKNAGAQILHVYGSYSAEPYERATSNDLIAVWWRPLCG